MSYVLIIIAGAAHPALDHVEFATMQACLKVRDVVVNQTDGWQVRRPLVYAECFENR